ncbi:MAG: hypothetical protein R2741_14640 [Methanolobus sp.]
MKDDGEEHLKFLSAVTKLERKEELLWILWTEAFGKLWKKKVCSLKRQIHMSMMSQIS